MHPADLRVEFATHNSRYTTEVTRADVEKVIPADQTRVHTGELVSDVCAAIQHFDTLIDTAKLSPARGVAEVTVAALQDAREALMYKLDEIGVTVPEKVPAGAYCRTNGTSHRVLATEMVDGEPRCAECAADIRARSAGKCGDPENCRCRHGCDIP